MGFVSLQEDSQEYRDENQRALERKKMALFLSQPDKINKEIERERETQAAKIKQLQDEQKIKEYDQQLWHNRRQHEKPSTSRRSVQRFPTKLWDRLTAEQKAQMIEFKRALIARP